MKRIIAAPFRGEFGWECMVWAPWLRHEQDRLQQPFLVLCETGHAALYEDFAQVIEVPTGPPHWRRDCQHAYTGNRRVGKDTYLAHVEGIMMRKLPSVTPFDMPVVWATPEDPPVAKWSKWHKMGHHTGQGGNRGCIGVHARMLDRCADRNWSKANWNELVARLVERGEHVVATGTPAGAYLPKGAVDLRGRSVEMTCHDMRECDLVVGPSSGPLHLANLCERPVVWWSKHPKNDRRYAEAWNPFGCRNVKVAESWNPTVEEVLACIRS